ncbi:putative (di)nucleoside polyphosphate hydrolase [Parasphingorhabdus marina DSM 22363]|uniref:RNA pyrophosphohydrolase n=1 Tax=Parasphingorhabdus marina DSM 22363 TaxID=1123272 RepID=A0A1N6GAL4_9SPHN|nr:RNA pyrophosphohydrolase [Parasphingorhabdus marina]SIO04548.1 putative (di)nucleoside polyphosphate hydrolase [Parasphingorhabdus marina DSM 22363]
MTRSSDPFAELPYRPCAGVMLANRRGQVFAGQRLDAKDSAFPDAWQMPQGGIDPGEDAEMAAVRELEEETGIAPHHIQIIAQCAEEHFYDLPDELMGKIWKGKYRGQRQTWFLMRFTGEDSDVNIATDHPEFSAWKWMHPQQLPNLIVPFKRDLYRAIISEFEKLI